MLDQDTPPAPLHHLFDLVGAGVRSYFLLHINPGKYYMDTLINSQIQCLQQVLAAARYSGVAKLGHTEAHTLATGGCAPPVQALLKILGAECTVINRELGAKSVQKVLKLSCIV